MFNASNHFSSWVAQDALDVGNLPGLILVQDK